jgi:hypothetical protein
MASITTRPDPAAAAATEAASVAFDANGFSHSTCLPASMARNVHGACSEFGSGT